jgi:hypothetical protein
LPVETSGEIRGVVKTPAGALVPRAEITYSGGVGRTTSNSDGSYVVALIRKQPQILSAGGLENQVHFVLPDVVKQTRPLALRTAFPQPMFGSLPRRSDGSCSYKEAVFRMDPSNRGNEETGARAASLEIPVRVSSDCRFTLDDISIPGHATEAYAVTVSIPGHRELIARMREPYTALEHPRPVCFDKPCRAKTQGSLLVSVVDARGVLLQAPAHVRAFGSSVAQIACTTEKGQCLIHNLHANEDVQIELRIGEKLYGTFPTRTVYGIREVVLQVPP